MIILSHCLRVSNKYEKKKHNLISYKVLYMGKSWLTRFQQLSNINETKFRHQKE